MIKYDYVFGAMDNIHVSCVECEAKFAGITGLISHLAEQHVRKKKGTE